MEKKKNLNLTNLILIILLLIVAFLTGSFWRKSNNLEKNKKNDDQSLVQVTPTSLPTQSALVPTLGRFSITNNEICQEDGKPVLYYFGYSGCPHCLWNHPILETVIKKFPTEIVFHDGMDRLEKLTTEESKILSQYQEIHGGGVPFFALGCKYVRVGSGENNQETDGGKATEEKNLTAIICKLTNGQPEKVCSSVKDLIDQIK